MSVMELNPHTHHEFLDSKDISFSVMDEEAVDKMLDIFLKKADEIRSNIKKISSDVDKTLEALRG